MSFYTSRRAASHAVLRNVCCALAFAMIIVILIGSIR